MDSDKKKSEISRSIHTTLLTFTQHYNSLHSRIIKFRQFVLSKTGSDSSKLPVMVLAYFVFVFSLIVLFLPFNIQTQNWSE